MLASGSLWVFFFFFHCWLLIVLPTTHTQTHTHTDVQCYSNRFRFLFIYTLSCLPWQLVSTPRPVCLTMSFLLHSLPSSSSFSLHSFPYYLTLLPLPIFLYIFFFYYWLHLFCSSFRCVVVCVFVYASFWFSQLKLYLLFLFSLVIPHGQQEQEQHQLDLSPYRTESALVSRLPFSSSLFFCSTHFSGFVCFVSWVRRRLQVYLCFGLYSAQSAPPILTPTLFGVFCFCLNLCGRNLFKFMWLLSNWFQC